MAEHTKAKAKEAARVVQATAPVADRGGTGNGTNGQHVPLESLFAATSEGTVEQSLESFIAKANSTYLDIDGWDLGSEVASASTSKPTAAKTVDSQAAPGTPPHDAATKTAAAAPAAQPVSAEAKVAVGKAAPATRPQRGGIVVGFVAGGAVGAIVMKLLTPSAPAPVHATPSRPHATTAVAAVPQPVPTPSLPPIPSTMTPPIMASVVAAAAPAAVATPVAMATTPAAVPVPAPAVKTKLSPAHPPVATPQAKPKATLLAPAPKTAPAAKAATATKAAPTAAAKPAAAPPPAKPAAKTQPPAKKPAAPKDSKPKGKIVDPF